MLTCMAYIFDRLKSCYYVVLLLSCMIDVVELSFAYIILTEGGEDEGHLQLITHALAGAQSSGSKEDGHIQVITQEVSNMEELGVEGAGNIQVITLYMYRLRYLSPAYITQ